jgi:hypothetical protein
LIVEASGEKIKQLHNVFSFGQGKPGFLGVIRDSWLCLRLSGAELSVPLGAGFSLFCILNIEYPPASPCPSALGGFCGSAVHILKDLIADS